MHSFVLVACTVVACLGSESEAERPSGGPASSDVSVEVEGAVLTYAPREIPRAKRGPRGEMEWIQKARAAFKVEKPIGFRRAVLPAGEYRLRVEVEDGTSHYLLVEPATRGEEEEGVDEGDATGKAGKAGKAREARRKGGEDASVALEKKEREKEEAPRADPPAKDSGGQPGGGKRKAGSPDPAPLDNAPETGSMRVPLAIAPCEKTSDRLAFGLKLAQKGSKLRITVRAGTTEARASLRFGAD